MSTLESFGDPSRRNKLRAAEDLRQMSSQELSFAAASAYHVEGRGSVAGAIEALCSPGRGPRLAAAFHDNSSQRL